MQKFYIIFFIIFCVLNAQVPHWFVSPPETKGSIYVESAITGKFFNKDLARRVAVHRAATKIAKQMKVELVFELTTLSDGRFVVDNPNFEEKYDEALYNDVLSNYKIIDSLFTNKNFFYLIQYPGTSKPIKVNHQLVGWGKKPQWIEKMPENSDYHFGVGMVSNYYRFRRGWKDSDGFARFALGKNIFINVKNSRSQLSSNNYTIINSYSSQYYNLTIYNCKVISRWYDQKSDQFYSLCRLPKNSHNK